MGAWTVTWKTLVVGGALSVSAVAAGTFKLGAARQTFESNLAARASVLAWLPAEKAEGVFPELKAGGTDAAEVWDSSSGAVVYQSDGAKGRELPKPAGVRESLTVAGVDGAVGLRVQNDVGGPERVVTYASSRSPVGRDLMQSAVVLGVFVILPAVAFVMFWPAGGLRKHPKH